jgi:hypothetical protein
MILQKGMPSLASRSSPLEHVFGDAEGRAIGGEARQQRQGRLLVRPLRIRANQGGQFRCGEVSSTDDRLRRIQARGRLMTVRTVGAWRAFP